MTVNFRKPEFSFTSNTNKTKVFGWLAKYIVVAPIMCLGFSDRSLFYGEVLAAFSNNLAVIILKKRQLAALL